MVKESPFVDLRFTIYELKWQISNPALLILPLMKSSHGLKSTARIAYETASINVMAVSSRCSQTSDALLLSQPDKK